ncbi:MAG: type II toxin-antitoxin system HicA family toxin [Opitutaceae bacterium]
MKLPRDISGRHLAGVLVRHWGYRQVNQVGSHIILQTEQPQHHRLSVPDHAPLRIGTFNAILRAVAAAKRVNREDIVASL